MQKLRPVVYRWRETTDTQAREGVTVDEAALRRECRPLEDRIRRIRQQQVAGRITDQEAEDQVAECRSRLAEIRDRRLAPTVEASEKRRPGRRLHMGLIAQEVRDALEAAGADPSQYGAWKQAPDGEQSLAYRELTIPMLKAIQELAAEVEALKRGRE